jgi:hypothetical protein
MSINQLPQHWETQRLKVTDSTLDDVPELQQTYDAKPTIWGWMGKLKMKYRIRCDLL